MAGKPKVRPYGKYNTAQTHGCRTLVAAAAEAVMGEKVASPPPCASSADPRCSHSTLSLRFVVTSVISVSHLGKRYGRTVAVQDVSLEVFEGEIFGLIGPNGAGKTTTMECIEGNRWADRGTISVLGLDPRRDANALRQRIGVQHQEAQLQKRIRDKGTTVFLTTHRMEEAERLCDRVAIIEHGCIIELGTTAQLVNRNCPE